MRINRSEAATGSRRTHSPSKMAFILENESRFLILLLAGLSGLTGYVTFASFSQVKFFILLHLLAVLSGLIAFRFLANSLKGAGDVRISRTAFHARGTRLIIGIVCSTLFSLALLSLRQSSFYRSLAYDVISAILAASLCVLAVGLDDRSRTSVCLTMVAILCFAYVNKSSVLFLNLQPGWYDGAFHLQNSVLIAQRGAVVPELGPYVDFALFHVRAAVLLLLANLSPVIMLAVLDLAILVVPVAVFLIVRGVGLGVRSGLLGALLQRLIHPLVKLILYLGMSLRVEVMLVCLQRFPSTLPTHVLDQLAQPTLDLGL